MGMAEIHYKFGNINDGHKETKYTERTNFYLHPGNDTQSSSITAKHVALYSETCMGYK